MKTDKIIGGALGVLIIVFSYAGCNILKENKAQKETITKLSSTNDSLVIVLADMEQKNKHQAHIIATQDSAAKIILQLSTFIVNN